VPVQSSRVIAAAKTRGLCRLVEVPGAGHLGCYSQNPAQYEQAVQAFLQQAIG
jgi:pimeloyl-ACP methyl ester carboxylesterase